MRVFLILTALVLAYVPNAMASDWDNCRSADHQSAVTGCSQIIDGARAAGLENSGLAEAYVLRGKARVALKENEEAVSDFGKAIELEPLNADAYFERGLAHKAGGKYELAIRDFDTAAKLNANAAPADKLGAGQSSNDTAAVEEGSGNAAPVPVTKPAAAKERTAKPKAKKTYKKKQKRQASKPKPKQRKKAKQKPKDDVWKTVNQQLKCSVNGGFDC